jgi:hypothetical protein
MTESVASQHLNIQEHNDLVHLCHSQPLVENGTYFISAGHIRATE